MNLTFKKTFSILLMFISLTILLSLKNNEQAEAIKNFRLLNVDGKYVSLSDFSAAKGFIIVFTSNHCPFAKLYPERLNNLNSKFTPLGIPLIAINSMDTVLYSDDGYANMIKKAAEEHLNFPYLFDGDQEVAKIFNAQKTPHAYVLWKENGDWLIKYTGAIDDNGAEPEKVKNRFVENAIDDLLAGRQVRIAKTNSIGCQIKFRN
jgi:peroxiredoxin